MSDHLPFTELFHYIFHTHEKKTPVSENDTFIFIEFKSIAENTCNEWVWEACASYKSSIYNSSYVIEANTTRAKRT